jgi:hypothetical protein
MAFFGNLIVWVVAKSPTKRELYPSDGGNSNLCTPTRDQTRQPPIYEGQPHPDQRHAEEVPGQQRFAQHERTEQNGADGVSRT